MCFPGDRGLMLSQEKSVAFAFTARRVAKYPIMIQNAPVPFVKCHTFLGVTLESSLTWKSRLKKKLSVFVKIFRYVGGIRWGTSVKTHHSLCGALFLGLLRYSIPVVHGMAQSTMKDLKSIQAQALRVYLGLPRSTSTVGPFAEGVVVPSPALRTQETIPVQPLDLIRQRS